MNKRNFFIALSLSLLTILLLFIYATSQKDKSSSVDQEILSYEECIDLPGSIIQESFPPVCVTVDGKEVVKPITEDEEEELIKNIDSSDWIRLENELIGLSFEHPDEWGSPDISSTSSRNQIKFENGFTITKGVYYTDEQDRVLTVNELINKNTPARKIVTDYTMIGTKIKRASYDHSSRDRAELLVFPQDANGEILSIFFFYPKSDLEVIREFFGVISTIDTSTEPRLPSEPNESGSECIVTGCSSQICADEEVITTCEYREEYACYQSATCEKQANSECGWTMTDELKECLASAE